MNRFWKEFVIEYLPQLKRVISNCSILILPEKHYEYIEFDGQQIKNIKKISCDEFVYCGKKKTNIRNKLKVKYLNENEKTISVNKFVDVSQMSTKRLIIKPVKLSNDYIHREYIEQQEIIIPKEMEYVKIQQNISIVNLNEVVIDLLEVVDVKGKVLQTFKNWNKETENDLKEINEMKLTIWNDLFIQRNLYLMEQAK